MKRFPTFRQFDSMDCGSTCLRIISKYYGKKIDAATLRNNCFTRKDGVSLFDISNEAKRLGFHTYGARITLENFMNNSLLPCIVHWKQQHFIVVYKIDKKNVYVSDPGYGIIKYKIEYFLKYWLSSENKEGQKCGIALLLTPSQLFFQTNIENIDKINVKQIIKYLSKYKIFFFQILIGLFVGCILNLLFPFISQGIVDFGIENSDLNFVTIMLLAQLIIVMGQLGNRYIINWLMLHITSRIGISFISNFLYKLTRLPITFFDSKKVGDILQRIEDYSRIQKFITESLLNISISIFSFIIYSCVMGSYNLNILGVFLIGSILYLLWVILFLKKREKIDYLRFQIASKNQSNLMQLIDGMQDIKLNNCEKQKRWEWERLQVKAYNTSLKSLSLGQIQNTGGMFINQTKDIIISFLTAKSVISGDITFGMMMAIQYIVGQLNEPISQLISFMRTGQDAKLSLERLNEIFCKRDEESDCVKTEHKVIENADICLKNVSFQYNGPHSRKVLDKINLIIPAKKVTAIVGHSGSGKTTLLKTILGFYPPNSGEIFVGGYNLDLYDKSMWRANCGAVMQDGYIFSDTIANNIGISETNPNMDDIRQAAKIANIDHFINELPLKYNTIIGMEGVGLSSGQKQRILIARAVFKNAKYIIFDEATNSLDANNERVILDKLSEFFIEKTVIVAAHRLSTIKKADQIVVLEHGKIIEIGKHDELIKKRGVYFQLVKNQLEIE